MSKLFQSLALLCALLISQGCLAGAWEESLMLGIQQRSAGDIQQSITQLNQVFQSAPDESNRVRAEIQLGLSLVQAHRLDEAERLLQDAYEKTSGSERISVALSLGNIAFQKHDRAASRKSYSEAISLAGQESATAGARVFANLNLARLETGPARLTALEAALPEIQKIADRNTKAGAYLNVGKQIMTVIANAQTKDTSTPTATSKHYLQLAYDCLTQARESANGEARLAVEILDALAQLYENQGRLDDAMRLTQSAREKAGTLPIGAIEDVLMRLEWRMGRIHHAQQHDEIALLSYYQAALHARNIRQDMPLEDEEGRSTYQSTTYPILLGLTDLLLRQTPDLNPETRASRTQEAIDTVELTRQSEMQDFLGERCSVEVVDQNITAKTNVATLYPIILDDRLQLVLKTAKGTFSHTATPSPAELKSVILRFYNNLQRYDSDAYKAEARKLYDWIMKPLDEPLAQSGASRLVIIPDGVLRLVPFSAMYDGKQFVAQKYVISMVTGMTMTDAGAHQGTKDNALLAGLSEPGPVVGKLADYGLDTMVEEDSHPASQVGDTTQTIRGIGLETKALLLKVRSASTRENQTGADAKDEATLKEAFGLPGVKEEINTLNKLVSNVNILDQSFTVARFNQETKKGDYNIIHIASHGFFGGSAQSSFLMAYDDVIKMNDLQGLIANKGKQMGGIDLLTLSACQTAEGNERAPLGIAGAAIKAKAKSVVGTLWPVSDKAAVKLMESFYALLPQSGKAESLALAQRSLIETGEMSHPFFWSPFVLIGNWN